MADVVPWDGLTPAARLIRIQVVELPKARRLVWRLRESENQGRRYF